MGRPRLPEPVKQFTRVQRAIDKLGAGLPGLEAMEADDVAALLARAEAGREALGRWIDGLRGRLG